MTFVPQPSVTHFSVPSSELTRSQMGQVKMSIKSMQHLGYCSIFMDLWPQATNNIRSFSHKLKIKRCINNLETIPLYLKSAEFKKKIFILV